MAADFHLKKGDRLPSLSATLKDSSNAAVPLTGATVVFNMRQQGAAALKITAGAVTIVDAVNGKVRYDWAAGDTDTVGLFNGEFQCALPAGQETVPNANHLVIQVHDRA